MAKLIYIACTSSGKVDMSVYRDLHTVLDYDALYDCVEMQLVHASWEAGEMRKMKEDQNGH